MKETRAGSFYKEVGFCLFNFSFPLYLFFLLLLIFYKTKYMKETGKWTRKIYFHILFLLFSVFFSFYFVFYFLIFVCRLLAWQSIYKILICSLHNDVEEVGVRRNRFTICIAISRTTATLCCLLTLFCKPKFSTHLDLSNTTKQCYIPKWVNE